MEGWMGETQTDRWTDGKVDRWDGWWDRQTDRRTGERTDRQIGATAKWFGPRTEFIILLFLLW